MILITSDFSEVERELDRLGREPSAITKAGLDAVLKEGLALAMAKVHVETGALKKSGRSKSSSNKATKTWKGTIQFGNHPGSVDYAYYEHRRAGGHDLLSVLSVLHPQWVAVIKKGLAP